MEVARKFLPQVVAGVAGVAVCLAGEARSLDHPRVVGGVRQHLLQPGVDVFAALTTELRTEERTTRRADVASADVASADVASTPPADVASAPPGVVERAGDSSEHANSSLAAAPNLAWSLIEWSAPVCPQLAAQRAPSFV